MDDTWIINITQKICTLMEDKMAAGTSGGATNYGSDGPYDPSSS